MDDNENRKHQMFARARDFGTTYASDFVIGGLGLQLFAHLDATVRELDDHAEKQARGVGEARQGTTTRAQAREALREDLEAINRTARAMADTVPGIDDKFRVPRGDNDQLLLQAARAFVTDATPLSAQFIAHELPTDFLAELNTHIAGLEAAMSSQSSGEGKHVAAGAAIDTTIDNGVQTVRKLDAIVKNKYANNSATLAEWTSASHTERAPRRNQNASAPPPRPKHLAEAAQRPSLTDNKACAPEWRLRNKHRPRWWRGRSWETLRSRRR